MTPEQPSRRAARDVALTAASVLAGTGGAVLLSILFLRAVGPSAESDGFFGAFSIYLLIVLLSPALRIVGPAWAQGAGDTGGRLVTAVSLGGVAIGIVLALAATPLSHVVAQGDAVGVARTALLVLAPCAALQLVGAAQAASLQMAGRFGAPALAYSLAGIAGALVFPLLYEVVGVDAMGLAFAASAVVLVGVQTAAGAARPAAIGRRALVAAWGALLAGSTALLSVSAAAIVSTALLARGDEGTVTAFSYTVYVVSIAYGLTGSSVAMVVGDRVRGDVAELIGPWRLSLAAMSPIVAGAAFGGATVIGSVLGLGDLTDELRRDIALLAAWAPAAAMVALAAAFLTQRGHARLLALVAAGGLATHVVLSLALHAAVGETGAVAAAGITPVLIALALVVCARPRAPGTMARAGAAALVLFGATAAVAFALPWLPVRDEGAVLAAVSVLVGVLLYALGLRALRVPETAALRALAPRQRAPA